VKKSSVGRSSSRGHPSPLMEEGYPPTLGRKTATHGGATARGQTARARHRARSGDARPAS
jgi:hypothetical protein